MNIWHGAFLDVSFRPLRGHPGCPSQMVSWILIGRWPRRGLKLTSRRPPYRPCLASLFRPMIDGSWPSRYIYIYINIKKIYIVQCLNTIHARNAWPWDSFFKVYMKWKLSFSYLKELLNDKGTPCIVFPYIALRSWDIAICLIYVNNTLHTSHWL